MRLQLSIGTLMLGTAVMLVGCQSGPLAFLSISSSVVQPPAVQGSVAPYTLLAGRLLGPSGQMVTSIDGPPPQFDGASLFVNQSAAFRLLEPPPAGTIVELVDASGRVCSDVPGVTDAEGNFTLPSGASQGGPLFLRATYTLKDRTVTLMAMAAPDAAKSVQVNPASTLVAKKITHMYETDGPPWEDKGFAPQPSPSASAPANVFLTVLEQGPAAATQLADHMSEEAIVYATVLNQAQAADAFDAIIRKGGDSINAPIQTVLAQLAPIPAPQATPRKHRDRPATPAPTPIPSPFVDIFAGTGASGFANGTGTSASFNGPWNLTVDLAGNVYVADQGNHAIRKITPAGVVTTLAGSGSAGTADGTGAAASFSSPASVAVDEVGNVYVSDSNNSRIRKVTPAGVVTTLAGSTAGYANGPGSSALFNKPQGIAYSQNQSLLYVVDKDNARIRTVTLDGSNVADFAGNGVRGYTEGPRLSASFNIFFGVAVAPDGTVYVADTDNRRIRKIATDGTTSSLVGDGTSGYSDGNGSAAKFSQMMSVALAPDGRLVVADSFNQRIRYVTATGDSSLAAGDGVAGLLDGDPAASRFKYPMGVAVAPDGTIYVADYLNHVIRRVRT